jgi:hypothetical protein
VAGSMPVVAGRALFVSRLEGADSWVRAALFLAFIASELFTLAYRLDRAVRLEGGVASWWITSWVALAVLVYVKTGRARLTESAPVSDARTWLRMTHGSAALLLLVGFLIAHLANHDLALWSVGLHLNAMNVLRSWYRSALVEPVLVALVLIMICTGVPMALHYCRGRLDAFRVTQVASGFFLAAFMVSHVIATLVGRRHGLDTNWFFAAGPKSLLDGGTQVDGSTLARLIPHYLWAPFLAMVHVGCGLRGVLLHHGIPESAANRVFKGMCWIGLFASATAGAALLGVHIRSL